MKSKFLLPLLVAVMMLFTSAIFAQDKKGGNPYRDPKTGRFMSKADYEKKYGPLKKDEKKDVKKGPARDPKTGRFIKKDEKHVAPAKDTKAPAKDVKTPAKDAKSTKGPARDPKTGKFLKKDSKAPAKDAKGMTKKDDKKVGGKTDKK